jgi:adenylate kinase
MVGLVVSRIEALKADDVLLLDGFPRTLPQAEALGNAAPSGSIGLALYFTASDDVLTERLLGRGRQDDTLEVIQHRLTVYRETTEPLVAYYRDQNLLREIQADRAVESIQTETSQVVKSVLSQKETA